MQISIMEKHLGDCPLLMPWVGNGIGGWWLTIGIIENQWIIMFDNHLMMAHNMNDKLLDCLRENRRNMGGNDKNLLILEWIPNCHEHETKDKTGLRISGTLIITSNESKLSIPTNFQNVSQKDIFQLFERRPFSGHSCCRDEFSESQCDKRATFCSITLRSIHLPYGSHSLPNFSQGVPISHGMCSRIRWTIFHISIGEIFDI
jgi:hypothetical protein